MMKLQVYYIQPDVSELIKILLLIVIKYISFSYKL